MNHSFESENELLIFSPTPKDFDELKIKFDEKEAKVIYLAQIKEATDDNSYDSFVFYHKDGKSYIFHEHENPASYAYETNIVVGGIDDYWKQIIDLEAPTTMGAFKKMLEISNNYKELDLLLENSQSLKPKKQKM